MNSSGPDKLSKTLRIFRNASGAVIELSTEESDKIGVELNVGETLVLKNLLEYSIPHLYLFPETFAGPPALERPQQQQQQPSSQQFSSSNNSNNGGGNWPF